MLLSQTITSLIRTASSLSGLVAQPVEQRSSKSEGSGFKSHTGLKAYYSRANMSTVDSFDAGIIASHLTRLHNHYTEVKWIILLL